jgi:hypothetical protein
LMLNREKLWNLQKTLDFYQVYWFSRLEPYLKEILRIVSDRVFISPKIEAEKI